MGASQALLRHKTIISSLPSSSNVARYVYSTFAAQFRHKVRQLSSVTRPTQRNARTKVSVKLEDLPQGIIALDPLPDANVPEYPTVVQQARSNMRRFENCVLLTRVGGFYELYFEHADEMGPLLNLKVAQKRTNAGPVSMVAL